MDWWEVVRERLVPAGGEVTAYGLVIVIALAAGAVQWQPVWRRLRVVVTLAHELGHALVGMACGRRFTGFVVRGDASGHAVTVGPARGIGRIATTWAGYPAPALASLLLIWAGTSGYAAPLLTALLLLLLAVVTQVRSLGTAAVVVLVLAATAALWWWRDDTVQAYAAALTGLVLLAGAWRGLVDVARHGRAIDDHAVLASLTRTPRALWLLSWFLVIGSVTATAARQLLGAG